MTPRPLPRALAILAACLLLAAAGPIAADEHDREWIYTVRTGDNPWNLTERYLDGLRYWPRIQQLNAIRDPLHIPPGTRLRIPVSWLRPVPTHATVIALAGSAEALDGATRDTRPVAVGMVLDGGDAVETARESRVTIEFADGSRVLVHADSLLVLQELTQFENTDMVDSRLRLERGRGESVVKPASGEAGRFEIRTPAATTSVRGTDFRVGVEGVTARAEVTDGTVAVSGAGRSIDVPEGFGVVAESGAPPSEPVPLLPPPDLASAPALFDVVPLSFRIDPLAGAVAYRVQIADDLGLERLRFDARFDSPALRGPDLPDGEYVLRVRGIDARGLEGADAVRRITIDARPVPPFPSAPVDGAGVLDERPEFRWGAVDAADRYRFQLATSADFASPIVDVDDVTEAGTRAVDALAPGVYHWRVASIDEAEGQGPFGDPQSFRRPPPGPALGAPSVDENTLAIRWRVGFEGQSYRVQMAADESFDSPLVDERTGEAGITAPRPDGGSYWVRVQTIDVDGYEGPFGPPQRIEVPSRPWPWWLLLLPLMVFAL